MRRIVLLTAIPSRALDILYRGPCLSLKAPSLSFALILDIL